MGPHLLATNLIDDEIVQLKNLLLEIGPKWSQISVIMGKTTAALKTFYYYCKNKHALDTAVAEYYKLHPGEERRTTLTDGDESDLSTSSCDEREANSDTASAESPKNNIIINSSILPPKDIIRDVVSNNDDRLVPPMGHAPRKSSSSSKHHGQQEEYDSSATETADEENESSPANRQSPKALYPNQATISSIPGNMSQPAVHPNIPNGPITNPTNMRDFISNVIERSLKTSSGPPPVAKPPVTLIKQPTDTRNDLVYVRDSQYRTDGKISMGRSQPMSQNSETLATLSIVDSQGNATQLSQIQGIPSQIPATITPVHNANTSNQGSSIQQQQQQQQQLSQPHEKVLLRNEPEDLSIKKTIRDTFPSPQSSSMSPKPPQPSQNISSNVTLSRYETSPQIQISQQPQPNQNNIPSNQYLSGYHHDFNRSSKSPSVYGPSVGMTMNIPGRPPHQTPPPQQSSMQPQSQQAPNKMQQTKLTPKLSPKINQNPKGSITHGTPVNSSNILVLNTSTTLSPRFDGIRRQTPPSNDATNKMIQGSITQGTPVLLSGHHMPSEKHRVYEYYKSNRQSPQNSVPANQPPANPPQFSGHYARPNFGMEQPAQLSSKQIMLNDYITSQQMQGQQSRGGNVSNPSGMGNGGVRIPEKEPPSPRSAGNLSGSPAALYYSEKDRGRPDYLSRTSPAEHIKR